MESLSVNARSPVSGSYQRDGIFGAQMTPPLSRQNVVNVRWRHEESRGESSLSESFREVQMPNLSDICIGQLCVWHLLAAQIARMICPILRDHIGHVVELRAAKQVARVAAWWIVAAVEDMRLPRISMLNAPSNAVS